MDLDEIVLAAFSRITAMAIYRTTHRIDASTPHNEQRQRVQSRTN